MDSNILEQLMYLLKYMDDYIECSVYNVLNDSQEDPHYSAVTTSNLIVCYINVMNYFKEVLPFHDVKSYFDFNLLTDKEYKVFEESKNREKEYYIGTIY